MVMQSLEFDENFNQEVIDDLKKLSDLITPVDEENIQFSGAWAWKQVLLAEDHGYQVLNAWNYSGDELDPMKVHKHQVIETFIVLSGTVTFLPIEDSTMFGREIILSKGDSFTVPPGILHSAIISVDGFVIIICIPAEEAYVHE